MPGAGLRSLFRQPQACQRSIRGLITVQDPEHSATADGQKSLEKKESSCFSGDFLGRRPARFGQG
jgi:hypothetical protein